MKRSIHVLLLIITLVAVQACSSTSEKDGKTAEAGKSEVAKFRNPGRPIIVSLHARKLSAVDPENYILNPLSDYYEIAVRDNGVGFNTASTEKMFQMFQRFHNKSTYPGAGNRIGHL